MKKRLKSFSLWLLGIIFVVGLSTICIYILNTASSRSWKGFYYTNSEYPAGPIQERIMLDRAATFASLQDCMKWGSTITVNNSRDAFECSYGCKYDEEYNAVVCDDTTKMINKDRFIK